MLSVRVGLLSRSLLAGVALVALSGIAGAQDMPPIVPPAANPAPPSDQNDHSAANPAPAQNAPSAENTPPSMQTAAVPPSAPPEPAGPAAQPLPSGKLDQLVAPVALYPDPLLSQVLMASTYPLEVVEAARWTREPANRALSGDALTGALKPKNWDPSVMALVAFPRLLSLMADKLEWTEQLGDAFLAQQTDVMGSVQRLRHEALTAGNLKVTPECHCQIQTSGETISILPAEPQLVCIPHYNPRVVYGEWLEPAYPPIAFAEPVGFAYEPGIAIGFGPVIELAAFGPLWGWGWIDWSHRDIAVDPARFAAIGGRATLAGGVWVHDPEHRRSVAYADPAVTSRFGAARVAAVTGAGRMALGQARGGAAHFSGPRQAAPSAAGAAVAGPGRHGGGPHFGRAAPARFGGEVIRGAGRAHFGAGRAHFGADGPHGGGAVAAHFGGGAPHGGGGPHGGAAPAHFGGGGRPHGGGAPHGGGGGPHGGGGDHHH